MQPSEKKNSFIKALIKVKEDIKTDALIEIIGNKEAVIQGSKGIIEYNDELIRISLDSFEVQFYGRKLTIQCLTQDSLEIKGIISRIEYI